MVNGHRTPLDLPDWAESIGEDGRPVALLGGGGRLGLAVASQLARAGLPVRVVEHRVERAERAMNHLVEEGAHAVTALCADWRDPSSLDSALGGSRLVILAAGPEVPAPMVAAAALRCGAHYMDCQFSDLKKLKGLQAFTDRARESHLCFITDCGIRPGMPAILLRHAAAQLKDVSRAEVYLAMALGA
ncbi:MAG: saccharopine dehydrogenase NADP-binding domain-containing protein, partial [Rhodospirillaceae bacterium]